jgi:hypothetical protein
VGTAVFVMTWTAEVLDEVLSERQAQNRKWGEQNHPDGTGPGVKWMSANGSDAADLTVQLRGRCQRRFAAGDGTWLDILLEELAEALAEDEPEKLRTELVQVAAVAVAWVEAIDRRLTP